MNNEIVLYQPDAQTRIEVQINGDTVWLTQQQIADLFGVKQPAISKHLKNIFLEGELNKDSVYSILEYTASDGKIYQTGFYNLDAILSVGYRVNSKNATLFRQWATSVLRQHILHGYSVSHQLQLMEDRIDRRLLEHQSAISHLKQIQEEQGQRIDFFVRATLPPLEGIFYDGQIFDAYSFVADLIRSAQKRILLIDNYVDDSVLMLLDKRTHCVTASIYTKSVSQQLKLDLERHNAQYAPIEVVRFDRSHDRFLCIDEEVYHIGSSLKDLGKKWFAFTSVAINYRRC